MPSCRSPRAYVNASDLTALHHVASGSPSMVQREHLNTLVGMGLVVSANDQFALTVEGLRSLRDEHSAQRVDDREPPACGLRQIWPQIR